MRIRFEPALVQELVLEESLRDTSFRQAVRLRLEAIYELPLEERAEKFAQGYEDLFKERGLGVVVEEEMAHFPLLASLEEILVFKAQGREEEEAELSRSRQAAGIKLKASRLSRPEGLRPFLRHELMHLSDLLDQPFGYQPQTLGRTPAEEHLYLQHYRLLWDVYIDGRLERQGLEGGAKQEERLLEWEHTFSFLPLRQRRGAFYRFWHGEGITHGELVALAQNPSQLTGEGILADTATLAPLPGSSCPLCRFPTFAWGDHSPVEKLIKADFPGWEPGEGACLRCVELYQLRAGVW